MTTFEIQGDGHAFLIFIGGVILIFTLFWLFAWALSKLPGNQSTSYKYHKRKPTRPYNEYDLMRDLYVMGNRL